MKNISLFQKFDAELNENCPNIVRLSACHSITTGIGILAGLGYSHDELQDFLNRILTGVTELMKSNNPSLSVGQNVDNIRQKAIEMNLANGGSNST